MVDVASAAGGSAGQTLTIAQLEALWIKAGGPAAKAPVAASVAMAESSGRTAVTSSNPDGGVNVGPWQLDTKGKGAGKTVAQLQNPLTNAQLAVKGSSGGADWSAWATYASGAYSSFMTAATSAIGTVEHDVEGVLKGVENIASGAAGAVGSLVGQVLGLPSQVTGLFTALERPVQALMWIINPANVARVIAGVLGFLLLGAGLITLGLAA
jgi:lysozyme-like protein